MMKLFKYFVGSLIISFGVLFVAAIVMNAMGLELPEKIGRYSLLIWLGLGVAILPFAKHIIRV